MEVFKVKKDIFYDISIIYRIVFISIASLFIYLLLTSTNSNDTLKIVNCNVISYITKGIGILLIYVPAKLILNILPTDIEKIFKINASNLPLTNKEIMWEGIRKWLILVIISIVSMGLIATLFEMRYIEIEFINAFLENNLWLILTMGFVLMIVLQVMGGAIISYAKDISWKKILPIHLIVSFGIAYGIDKIVLNSNIPVMIEYEHAIVTDGIMNSSNMFIMHMTIVILILLAISSIYFIYSTKYIEKVQR